MRSFENEREHNVKLRRRNEDRWTEEIKDLEVEVDELQEGVKKFHSILKEVEPFLLKEAPDNKVIRAIVIKHNLGSMNDIKRL